MIYFIADTHFNHENIIKYCSRPFKNKEEMNERLIKEWNQVISDDDIVYHLGDLILGERTEWENILSKLNGKKYIIRGNHDNAKTSEYEKYGFDVLVDVPIELEEYKLILSHVPLPDEMIKEGYVNVHGHIHKKKLNDVNERIGVPEYPSELYSEDKHICVSVDVTEFKPVSINKVLEIYMNKKQ